MLSRAERGTTRDRYAGVLRVAVHTCAAQLNDANHYTQFGCMDA